ncbi:MAG: hypothetical protein L6R40_007686 [Gallowayella cf. fulva]|nr:MAG: hypothetical protein L6R40_007686 [Xanthomendoza cf. fulva]
MASNHASLDAAATERKARLAKLKSLKRKQPDTPPADSADSNPEQIEDPSISDPSQSANSNTPMYLSGRNYDYSARGPKLGFDSAPSENAETLEGRADRIERETKEKEAKEEREDKPIDLFKLQPKKPNWDLKRDVARKMEVLNRRTDNAIARLVRERIEGAKTTGQQLGQDGGQELGIKGEELVEGVHLREREEDEEERREIEDVETSD